jgi:L-ribulose-5-phosphate 3-epimerase
VESPGAGVNFDPANMVLYDEGNPVQAMAVLAPWIRHVHIKDGIRTRRPGAWGREVPWGEGEVGAEAFLRELKRLGYAGALAIEREAGDRRVQDIRSAVERLEAFRG